MALRGVYKKTGIVDNPVCGCAGAWQGGAAAAGGGGAAREDVGAGHQQEEQPRAVRRQGGGQPRQHRVGSPGGQQYNIQLEINVHEVITI